MERVLCTMHGGGEETHRLLSNALQVAVVQVIIYPFELETNLQAGSVDGLVVNNQFLALIGKNKHADASTSIVEGVGQS